MAVVDLVIKLTDRATSGIKGIGAALSGLGSSASNAASQTQGLAGAIASGVLQANAIQFAIGKANEALGFLNSKFEEAKNLQLANVSAATTFSSLTGQSYEQAAAFIENLNSRLAKSAAALPGATQDYKNLAIAVQDNVLEAFKDPAGKLNQKGFEDTLASISESFGALSAGSNVAIGNTTLGLSKALGGASTSELRQIQFFEQNAVILNEIDKRLAKMGKSTLKDLNIKERVKLLEEVGKKFITEDFIREAGGSADALIQAYQSSLFDPSAGIFGIMRDLEPNTKGVQSAFSSMNEGLAQLIGSSGVMTNLSNLFSEMGIKFADPMVLLKGGIDFFVAGVKKTNQILVYAKNFLDAGGSLADFFSVLPSYLGAAGQTLPGLITSQVSRGVYTLTEGIVTGLGQTAQTFMKAITGQAPSMKFEASPALVTSVIAATAGFALLNSGIIGATISTGAMLLSMGGSAIGVISAFGTAIKVGAVGSITGLSRAATGVPMILGQIPGAIALVTTSLKGLTIAGMWSSIVGGLAAAGAAVGTFATTMAVSGVALLANPIVLGIGAIALIGGLIYKYWQPLGQFFSGVIAGINESLKPLAPEFQAVGSALAPVFDAVGEGLQAIAGFFRDLLTPVKDTTGASKNFGETIGKFVGGAILGTIKLVGQLIGGIKDFAGAISRLPGVNLITGADASPPVAPVTSVTSTPAIAAITKPPMTLAAGSRFRGNIPNAADGLFDAAMRESKAMPSGAQLVVANSKEFILQDKGKVQVTPPTVQVAAPTPAPVSTIQNRGGNTYNLSFSVASGDPNAIAQAVIAAIQQTFEGELEAQLG